MSLHHKQPEWIQHPFFSSQNAHTEALLSTNLSAAVPLWVLTFYELGGPDAAAIEQARAFGHTLAEKGDRLLYRSTKEGETAELFNGLAKSLAVLSFLPGGVPFVFGGPFDARDILSGFIGRESAEAYCRAVIERYDEER